MNFERLDGSSEKQKACMQAEKKKMGTDRIKGQASKRPRRHREREGDAKNKNEMQRDRERQQVIYTYRRTWREQVR